MIRVAAFLAIFTLLVLAGRHLVTRPPGWLAADPLLSPFGATSPEENSAGAGEKPAEDRRATPEDPVDLTRASAEELTRLPGVGPVLAKRIVALRDSLGGFADADQLQEVKGIGPKTLRRLIPLVRLAPSGASQDSTQENGGATLD